MAAHHNAWGLLQEAEIGNSVCCLDVYATGTVTRRLLTAIILEMMGPQCKQAHEA
jgi:hypothetical protein